MPYNSLTSRTDVAARIPEQVVNSLLGKATEESAVLRLFQRIPVAATQTRMPVLSGLPMAYWVTGDTGLKQTTEIAWANKYLNVEEIATILPIPNNVADDVDFDVWGEAEPLLAEAVGRAFDAAVFFGTNAPGTFPTNVNAAAAAAGNNVTVGTNNVAAGGFFGDFDDVLGTLELDGFEMTGVAAAMSVRARLRKARNADGDRIDRDRITGQLDSIDGVPVVYPMRGLWPTASGSPILFAGDWKTNFVYGVRKDVTYEMFREGVIQDNTGAIVYNLLQQDMSAIRVTFRAGWQVANRINNDQPTEANRYPAAVLRLA